MGARFNRLVRGVGTPAPPMLRRHAQVPNNERLVRLCGVFFGDSRCDRRAVFRRAGALAGHALPPVGCCEGLHAFKPHGAGDAGGDGGPYGAARRLQFLDAGRPCPRHAFHARPLRRGLLARYLSRTLLPLALYIVAGDRGDGAACLSHGLFRGVPCFGSHEIRLADPAHHSVLDELSAARLRVEDHPRLQRRHQFGIDGARHHSRTARIPSLQHVRSGGDAGACLGRVRDPSDLCLAGEDRPFAARSRRRSRRWRHPPLPAHHPALVAARRHRRGRPDLRAHHGRLRHAHAGGRIGWRDDRQCDRGAVRQDRQLADGCGTGDGQHGGGGIGHASVGAGRAPCRFENTLMRRRGPKRNLGLVFYAVLYLAFLYLPVLFLPLFSFNDSAFIAFPLVGFTTKWYGQMLADSAMHTALWNSLKVGAAVALASTALGLLAAKALTRYRLPGGAAVLGFTSLPLFIPDIVLGISLLILLNTVRMQLSLISVMLGHILICAPFAITVLMSRFDGFDKSLEEASLDLGENAWTTFWRVTFPLVLPGIISSLLLTFIVSFDEFLIAYFLAGTEATLPIYIWGQLRFPYKLPVVLALGAVILVVSCVLVVLAEWMRGLGQGGKRMVGA